MDNRTVMGWMERDPLVVSEHLAVADLARLMVAKQVSGACVVAGDRLVGVVSETDLRFRGVALHLPTLVTMMDCMVPLGLSRRPRCAIEPLLRKRVGDIVRQDCLTVLPTASLEQAAMCLASREQALVPVVERGHLIGAVTPASLRGAGVRLPVLRSAVERYVS